MARPRGDGIRVRRTPLPSSEGECMPGCPPPWHALTETLLLIIVDVALHRASACHNPWGTGRRQALAG